jgi:transposase
MGYSKHFRVHHEANEFVRGISHFNWIECFRVYALFRLIKFKGISKRTFYLRLKETEFKFNHKNEALYQKLLLILRNNPNLNP